MYDQLGPASFFVRFPLDRGSVHLRPSCKIPPYSVVAERSAFHALNAQSGHRVYCILPAFIHRTFVRPRILLLPFDRYSLAIGRRYIDPSQYPQ